MNIGQYIAEKYKGQHIVVLSYHEASAFGVPYPLRSGWHQEYGGVEITDDMHFDLVERLKKTIAASGKAHKIHSAMAGLYVLGEEAPALSETIHSSPKAKQPKAGSKLARQMVNAKNCLKGANKKYKPPAPVRMNQPTESSVLSFTKKSKINPMDDEFLRSFEWRSVRMMALKRYGSVCQCCGASPATGAVVNVDHIKPRKIFPNLALSVDNLQVLCHECNHGKGNWDMTDWRKDSKILQKVVAQH